MIGQRISELSCDKAAFEKAGPYNQVLQRSDAINYESTQFFPQRTAVVTTRKRENEASFGSTHFIAKMFPKTSKNIFFLMPFCNYRNKHDCVLEGKPRSKCVIYKALMCTPNGKTMLYYG